MPRIENIEMEDMVADSLLADDNVIAILPHQGNQPQDVGSDAEHGESQFDNPEDYFAEAIYEQEHNATVLGDDGLQQKLGREQQEQGRQPREQEGGEEEQPEAAQQEQEQPEPQEQNRQATEQEIQASFSELESFAEASNLTSGEKAAVFPHELVGALGTTLEASGIDPQGVIDVSAKAIVSGLRELETHDFDMSAIPQPSPRVLQAAGYDVAQRLGYDPRAENVNLVETGAVWRELNLNILRTINETGLTDPAKINSREAIEYFIPRLKAALGSTQPMNFAKAQKFADAYTRRVVACIDQLRQNQASQQAPTRAQRRGGQRVPASMREGIKGAKPSRFKSNQDIFDNQTMNTLAMRRL